MSETFTLADPRVAMRLREHLARAEAFDGDSVRLVAAGGTLAVYTQVLTPRGSLDRTPTVLGMFPAVTETGCRLDAVVPSLSLRRRLERALEGHGTSNDDVRVRVPLEVGSVSWAGLEVPHGRWRRSGVLDGEEVLRGAAEREPALWAQIPEDAEPELVRHVLAEVDGRGISADGSVPIGAAHAAVGLGLVEPGVEVTLHEAGPWTRLSTPAGHVLVKRRNWTLKR